MLREYRLTNFKAFGETVTIPVRPLTLIFGPNSSGKSSIFQSLLMLKQTLEETKTPETALLPKGSLVDLGRYSDFVHRHESQRKFQTNIQFTIAEFQDRDLFSEIGKNKNRIIRDEYGVETRVLSEWKENPTGQIVANLTTQFCYDQEKDIALNRGSVTIGDETHPTFSYILPRQKGETKTLVEINSVSEFWRRWWKVKKECIEHRIDELLEEADEYFRRLYGIQEEANDPEYEDDLFEDVFEYIGKKFRKVTVNYKNFLPERYLYSEDDSQGLSTPDPYGREELAGKIFLKNIDIFPIAQSVCRAFRSSLEEMIYVGPLRSQPEHYYEYSGDVSEYVGQRGESLPSILFKKPDILKVVNDDLKRLGVRYRLKLSKLRHEDKSLSDIFSLLLIDKSTGIDASIRDVGFGIGQVLPVVVQSGLSEKKTLLIEEPEIHLHPAHQAELGDMFIRSAKERGNTLLLETHSENLILRILRRIRETNANELPEDVPPIRPEDVAVLYVQPGENGAQVLEIPVTEDGDFALPWPKGFFEEREQDLF